jgi:hypothetical protein
VRIGVVDGLGAALLAARTDAGLHTQLPLALSGCGLLGLVLIRRLRICRLRGFGLLGRGGAARS